MNNAKREMISEQIIVLVARIYPLFRRIFQDYHPDEIAILHVLRAGGGELERRKLIKNLGIDPRIVSKRVRDLLKRGLVDTCRSPNSARESIDKITKKGNQEFENTRDKIKFLLKECFNFIDKEQQRIIEEIIGQASGGISKIETLVKTMLCA